MKKIGVSIIGGTGFGAGELLRLFASHPEVDVCSIVSSSSEGKLVSDFHPHLASFYNQTFAESFDPSVLSSYKEKMLFTALPHGTSAKTITELFETCKKEKIKVIDLSGDLRLKDLSLHAKYYPDSTGTDSIRKEFVYGLTELFREEIVSASFVANPGCLATAAIIAIAPLCASQIEPRIVLNLATGSSGSGRELKQGAHHPTRHSNMTAYKALNHQHEPEVSQTIEAISKKQFEYAFVPHSLPVSRGIYGTCSFTAANALSTSEGISLYKSFYKNSPFIRIVNGAPELQNVVGSNFTDISIATRGKEVVVMVALDNLVKGMSGQAIQNMNLMCRLPEKTGLWFPSTRPV